MVRSCFVGHADRGFSGVNGREGLRRAVAATQGGKGFLKQSLMSNRADAWHGQQETQRAATEGQVG